MSLAVVGSIAFDSVTTPFGTVERELGGSAVHAAMAASFFTNVRAIGPVGDDFERGHYELLEGQGIDTGGVQAVPGRETFFWRGRYGYDMNAETEETRLNAFDGWRPRLSRGARDSGVLFLAAMDPEIQADVRSQAPAASCVALDSMTYWIRNKPDALVEAIRGVDIVLMNDHEARELTRESMLLKAAREITALGPRAVALRLGEYGCALLSPEGFFSIPGYPLESVTDPTGSGDAFAGGFLGYLDLIRGDWGTEEALRRAVTYGCVMASFCVEDFGSRRMLGLTKQEIDYRFVDFRQTTHFEHVPLHPRPRGVLEAGPPRTLERPAPTGGTPVYGALAPTASAAGRSAGVARVWNQPNAFRRVVSAAEGLIGHSPRRVSTPFTSPAPPGNFPASSGPLRAREAATGPDGKGSGMEPMMYCVVPRALTRKVAAAIGRMYAEDPTVEVIVERREADRRGTTERRVVSDNNARTRMSERRRVRNFDGLRVAERRGVLVPSFGNMPLPRVARRFEHEIAFCGLLGPSPTWVEEVQSARLALKHQAGDTLAFEALYKMWFDRVYAFLNIIHVSAGPTEDAVQRVFLSAHDQIGEFNNGKTSFRSWLATRLLGVVEPAVAAADELVDADSRLLERWAGPPDMHALRWLRDSELLMLVGRLSSPQREVVGLHYLLGMSPNQIAEVLACSPDDVCELHNRGLGFMAGCVTSLSRRPGYSGRHPMSARRREGVVTWNRRMALAA